MITYIAIILTLGLILSIEMFLRSDKMEKLSKDMSNKGTLQIQCSTGDAEVVIFNHSLKDQDDQEEIAAKIGDALAHVDARREATHAKMMKIREEARLENEKKPAEELKLRSKNGV